MATNEALAELRIKIVDFGGGSKVSAYLGLQGRP